MREKDINEGLGDLAARAEQDHEVQMARADLYKIAKYAIKLHDMLKSVSEEQGMEGWQQAKITKAADYIGSVYHNLDYDMKFGDQTDEVGPEVEMEMGEGKFKSAAHRKAVHAAKSSGKRKGVGKKLRKEGLEERLAAKLEAKKTEAVSAAKLKPTKIKSKKIAAQTESK